MKKLNFVTRLQHWTISIICMILHANFIAINGETNPTDEIEENVPWGEDTLFTLEFREEAPCKYAIHTCNNMYLQKDGKLLPSLNKDCY